MTTLQNWKREQYTPLVCYCQVSARAYLKADFHFSAASSVARTGTIACSSIEKKRSDWLSLILVAKKLNLIQLPELAARSPVNLNTRFQLGFRAAHAQIAHRLVARLACIQPFRTLQGKLGSIGFKVRRLVKIYISHCG